MENDGKVTLTRRDKISQGTAITDDQIEQPFKVAWNKKKTLKFEKKTLEFGKKIISMLTTEQYRSGLL